MKKKKIILLEIVLISLLGMGCSKKQSSIEPRYTALEFMSLAHEAQPSHEKGEEALKLSDYADGVNRIDSTTLKFNRLVFFAVEFESTAQALAEAKRLNQYYSRNWLLDRVEGEPILEDYVIKTFNAVNPNRKIQRVPKKDEGHSEGHSETHAQSHGEAHH